MQCGPRSSPSWHREHLWLTLQALGLDLGSEAAAAGKTLTHVTCGENMFDKPNKDCAFVVFHFLFAKLDSVRCKEVFRHCWPPLDKKRDADFRKACCDWLRKISEEAGSGFPQVVASIFLSPGGPKFVQLLYHFARYVMLQHIRKDVTDASSHVPEALQVKVQEPQKALTRNKVARCRYLQMFQRQNLIIGEYHQKAQTFVKQIRELRAECAVLQNQTKSDNTGTNHRTRNDKIKDVRSLWNTTMQSLKTIEREVEVVDSVLQGNVDQYCMDGSNVSLNIPNKLVTVLENKMDTLQMENLYEAGKLNLTTVIQLLNEALKVVKQEREEIGYRGVPVVLRNLTGKASLQDSHLSNLVNKRHTIKREDLVLVEKAIAEQEKEWEKKWRNILGQSPFGIFKVLNPVFELQPPMAPFSFEPATDEVLQDSLFHQYTPCMQDEPVKDARTKHTNCTVRRSFMDGKGPTPSGRNSFPFLSQSPPVKRRMSLNEQDFRTPTPNAKERLQEKTPSSATNRRSDISWKTYTPMHCEADPKSVARRHLAQQVADFVAESPKPFDSRVVELDDLIGMLSSDPFLSKKEIPRTPENLISDIRTSWRKAIQSDSSNAVASPLESPQINSPADADSTHCSQIDLSMACFLSTSHVSEHNDSLDPRIPASTGTPVPFSQSTLPVLADETSTLGQGDVTGPATVSKTRSPLVDKEQDFVFEDRSSELMDNPLFLSVSRDHDASAHTTLSWNASKMGDFSPSLDHSGVIQFGILHETLPDGVGNISLNSTNSADHNDVVEDCKFLKPDGLLDKTPCVLNSTEPKMDLHSIRSRYEALKSTLFTSLTESGKSVPVCVSKQKSESSLPIDSRDVFSPLERGLMLDLEYLATPSPKTRKLSLPPLISFSPAEDVYVEKDVFSDVFESKGAVNLNETFEFSSDPLKCTDEGLGQLIKL
ncbi:HAUS augmin-like complex subunit 6 [Pelodytes ibericus]